MSHRQEYVGPCGTLGVVHRAEAKHSQTDTFLYAGILKALQHSADDLCSVASAERATSLSDLKHAA